MFAILLTLFFGCAPKSASEVGLASWYGGAKFNGKPTASGERFRSHKRTAAHKTLPFGTIVRVTRLDTGKRIRVVINDRGPYGRGRIIDLSSRSARKLGLIQKGVAKVKIEVIGCKKRYKRCSKHE